MSNSATKEIKSFAMELGADLVGVGNIERWENCPPLMSPAGILPTAKSVVVCGVRHTDAMIEVGGETGPHNMGPYAFQGHINLLLDHIAWHMARKLESLGFDAIPIAASNIWRYREYKDIDAVFAPDMSHIYSPIAAGLCELGYNGLAMSPEYGPRSRFISIITDAPLTPNPLLPGNTLCDMCGQCVKHCPMDAFTKEVKGEATVEIGGNTYTRCDKNLWRCSWGEHFGLNVNLPAPEVVDEAAILENVERHGMRGGTMGCCLKFCLPKNIRSWDREYSSAPRRIKPITPKSPEPAQAIQDDLMTATLSDCIDGLAVETRATCTDLRKLLPDAESVVMIATRNPKPASSRTVDKVADLTAAINFQTEKQVFDLARKLEDMGYSAAPYPLNQDPPEFIKERLAALADTSDFTGKFVVTSAVLTPTTLKADKQSHPAPRNLTESLKRQAEELDVDVTGIASAKRIAIVAEELKPIFEGKTVLNARDKAGYWVNCDPEVTEEQRHVFTPTDYLESAKSVIVIGVAVPAATVRRVCKPPAEAIGPYVFAQYQANNVLNLAAAGIIRSLEKWGHTGVATFDLTGTASLAANPRGPQPNAMCNRFTAVCAGLGTISKGGFVINPEHGVNLRFIAIVTDAELTEDSPADLTHLREKCDSGCRLCLEHCTVGAHREEKNVNILGHSITFHPIDQLRCDWALRYGLVPDEGVKYTGSTSDAPPPENITAEALADGMRLQDHILKIRPCVAEMCMVACPLAK